MTVYASDSPPGGISKLWSTLEKFESGVLSSQERDELDQLLGSSAEARSIYLEYFELVTLIEGAASIRAEEGRLPVLFGQRSQRKVLSYSLLAAAAALVLMAGIAMYVTIRETPRAVAEVEFAKGTQWSVDGSGQSPDSDGASIKPGSSVTVSTGIVALTMDSGARMVLQGPAQVSFPTMESPVLERGWLWFDSGGSDEGIQVETPELWVRDIGTRFGTRLREDGLTEVHLVDGQVEIEVRGDGRKVDFGQQTGAAMIPAMGEVVQLPLAPDPFPTLEKILASQQSYATTIIGQSPSGYWRLNDKEHGACENLIVEDLPGAHGPSVQAMVPGVQPAQGFGGFEEDNPGVYLPGTDKESVLYNLDVPGGVTDREGAVSFWFRREGLPSDVEMLWYTGRQHHGSENGLGGVDGMHAFLDKAGRLGFFMDTGRYDILLSSSRAVTDGKWHHVAASWGAKTIELFLDGRRLAEDSEFRLKSDEVFTDFEVRFGKARRDNFRQFHGWVDEIACWSRPLTFLEVYCQYQSAREAPEAESGDPSVKPE